MKRSQAAALVRHTGVLGSRLRTRPDSAEALEENMVELEYIKLLEAEAAQIRRGELKAVSLEDLEDQCELGD